MNQQELTYWVTLALMPKIWTKRKNELFVNCFNQNYNIIDLFEDERLWNELKLSQDEIKLFKEAKCQLSKNAFLVEDLLNQGYEIIPIVSKEYSPILKNNLKYNAPIVLFIKGNKQLLQEKSVAIVGSRKADDISLRFTDTVAKNSSKDFKVVVSGFAKGVDKQALDSALSVQGQSIIVLPQGIATFYSGMKQYYKQINCGDVLVLSTFHPKSPWSVELAMARNPIIYGLAEEIYVAQSDSKGGTWSGVVDGLRKGRTIYVRKSDFGEKNANNLLIEKGAKPIDIDGNLILESELISLVSEPATEYDTIEKRITELLTKGNYSSKEIIIKLNLSITDANLKKQLRNMDDIEEIKGKTIKFKIKNTNNEPTLF